MIQVHKLYDGFIKLTLLSIIIPVKRNILGQRKDYWGPVEALEVVLQEAKNTASSVRNLPGIK